MKLFSRKRSNSNIGPKQQPQQRVEPPPVPIVPLELPPEISTPLYERFARTRQEGDARGEEPATPLALFDGSSMGTKAGMRTLMQAFDPLEDTPPASFFATYVSPSARTPLSTAPQTAPRPSETSKIERDSREPKRLATRPSTADNHSSTVDSRNTNKNEHSSRPNSAMGHHPPVSGSSKPRGQAQTTSNKNLASPFSPTLSTGKSSIRDDSKLHPIQLPSSTEPRAGRGLRTTPSAPTLASTPNPGVATSRPPVSQSGGNKPGLTINTADANARRNGSNSRAAPTPQSHDRSLPQKSQISKPTPLSTARNLVDKRLGLHANGLASSSIAMEPPSPGRHLPHLSPAPSAPPPPIPHSSSFTSHSLPPPARSRTTSVTNHVPTHVTHQRGSRGDTPPVSGSPALKRRRNSIQSGDPDVMAARMAFQRAPSPSSPSLWPGDTVSCLKNRLHLAALTHIIETYKIVEHETTVAHPRVIGWLVEHPSFEFSLFALYCPFTAYFLSSTLVFSFVVAGYFDCPY